MGSIELAVINPNEQAGEFPLVFLQCLSDAGGSTLTPSRPRNGPLERNESVHLLPSLNFTVSETHEVLQTLTFRRTLLFY